MNFKVALLTGALLIGTASFAQTSNPQNPDMPQTTQPTTGNNQAMTQDNGSAAQNNSIPGEQSTGEPTVLVDPGKIYNEDPTHWVGKRVVLQNVMVEDADKNGNFWVGSDKHHRLFVVKGKDNPNLTAKEFHKGDIVTIDGTIHPAGDYEAQETNASNGKMKKARETSGVFLLANDVNIASSTQHK
jgi:hypothetical protein